MQTINKEQEFLRKFNFNPSMAGMLGMEREVFLTDGSGKIIPIANKVLGFLGEQDGRFGYELSACQLESRVGPIVIDKLKDELLLNEEKVKRAEKKLEFRRSFDEVGPYDMPLDVYPDPTGRYQEIVKDMPQEILRAACRVIATHIHVGMKDYETALKTYNRVIKRTSELCKMGDLSNGERLRIYKIMAPDFNSPHYENWDVFYNEAVEKDFVEDPRSCWHLIRISVHGTIEFRMFGTTSNIDTILDWARVCYNLCS